MSKYNSRRIAIDGYTFDSIKESQRYGELRLMEKAGEIRNLEVHPEFILQDKFIKNGKKYRSIRYIADFKYIKNGEIIVEDVKSVATKTDVYEMKRKMFENKYKELTISEVIC
jgi:hypothetical protein